jgi:type I restriction-modification system DNA methylase subunit
MRLRDKQPFLSLYYEANAVEVATGEAGSFASVESWRRETKQRGQVATPEPVAALMAKWVMSAKPRSVLDPAAGLAALLASWHQRGGRGQFTPEFVERGLRGGAKLVV